MTTVFGVDRYFPIAYFDRQILSEEKGGRFPMS